MIRFEEDTHSYVSTDGSNIKWSSVTTVVGQFKNKFDSKVIAEKSSKNKKSKWYGLSVDEILQIWENEKNRSTDLGSWYHNQRERDLLSHSTITRNGFLCEIKKPIVESGYKIAPSQSLSNNTIYPEHFVYLKSAGICGQSDLVEVINNKLFIRDYKSNKTIEKESYVDWEGKRKMMLRPIQHLQDCNLIHYTLQLSLYAYIILKHNPHLTLGGLELLHIKFEEESLDKYGYPIYKKDLDGNFIVKNIETIEIPYLKKECMSIIEYKNNKK